MTNSTLYGLLERVYSLIEAVRANTIPDNATLASSIAAACLGVETKVQADLDDKFTALQADLDDKFTILSTKLNQISAQVTGPETGDTNPATAKIS